MGFGVGHGLAGVMGFGAGTGCFGSLGFGIAFSLL